MNQGKFFLYNIISPKAADIPKIADYIYSNNLVNLPNNLRARADLFIELAKKNYPSLFQLNFSDNFYKGITSGMYDECLDSIIDYIKSNTVYTNIPQIISNSPYFLNEYLRKTGNLYDVLKYTNKSKELYDELDKDKILDIIQTGMISLKHVNNPFISEDEVLFRKILENTSINLVVPEGFSPEIFKKIGYDVILRQLEKGKIQLYVIPIAILQDRAFIEKVMSDSINMNYKKAIIDKIIKEGSKDNLELIYQIICENDFIISEEVYRKIDKQSLADLIINNQEIEIQQSLIKNDSQLFKILVEKKSDIILRIDFDNSFYQNYKNEILEIFKNSRSDKKLSNSAFMAISSSLQITEQDNFRRIAEYIIESRETNIFNLSSNLALFNYLYDMDIDFLFQINFSDYVYNEVPIEKLRAYYQKHHQNLDKINPHISLAIFNKTYNIDYMILKQMLLQIYRKESEKAMDSYSSLGIKICNYLDNHGANETYSKYENIFTEMTSILNITEEYIKTLLNNYISDKAKYEEEINDLARKFYMTKVEKMALEKLNIRLAEIKKTYTKADNKAVLAEAKKQKRKYLYCKYILDKLKSNNLTESETEIIKLISALNIADADTIIKKVLLGETIIKEPLSYKKQDMQKKYRRLKGNYEQLLNKIYVSNPEYREQIINYLKGEFSHEELRKILEKSEINTLREIRELCSQINANLIIENERLIFNGDFELTDKEIKDNKQYEQNLLIINKIQKLLNKEMNICYPLEKVDIDEYEISFFKLDDSKIKHLLNFSMVDNDDAKMMVSIINKGNLLQNEKEKRIFEKLFIEEGLLYSIPFVNKEYVDSINIIIDNMDYLVENFDEKEISIVNFEKIIRKVSIGVYVKQSDIDILGYDNAHKIVYNETFIGDKSKNGRRNRIAMASKYTSLASKNVKSTIPFITLEKDGFKAERYKSNDPDVLVSGIDTDACFRILGNDNDFLLYTMFNKNGFVLKITDEEGNFIGRISGFRNGNCLYLNQARSIMDMHGHPDKATTDKIKRMRSCIEEYARQIVEKTKETDEPIDYVFILKSYGYSDCDYLPVVNKNILNNDYPMNTNSSDYKEYKENPELTLRESQMRGFTTDYRGAQAILLLASSDNKQVTKKEDLKEYDPSPLYDRPRSKPQIISSDLIDEAVISKINSINARDIYWGDTETREAKKENYKSIKKLDNISLVVIGEDFYIAIDKTGNVYEKCLQYDKRATAEYEKYKAIILEQFNNTNTEEPTSNKKK